jgi:hypothetical protein
LFFELGNRSYSEEIYNAGGVERGVCGGKEVIAMETSCPSVPETLVLKGIITESGRGRRMVKWQRADLELWSQAFVRNVELIYDATELEAEEI